MPPFRPSVESESDVLAWKECVLMRGLVQVRSIRPMYAVQLWYEGFADKLVPAGRF